MARKPSQGFTIIELMLVVAVMGILATIALPAFTELIQNNRRAAAVNDMLASIHTARSNAITHNSVVSICRSNPTQTGCLGTDGPWQGGWIVFRDPNSNGTLDAGEDILTVGGPVRGSMQFVSDEMGAYFMFSPRGRMEASSGANSGHFRLCEQGAATAARVIIIELTGRPRVDTEVSAGTPGNCT